MTIATQNTMFNPMLDTVAPSANRSAQFPTDSETQRRRASIPRSKPMRDVVELQSLLKKAAFDPDTTAAALAQVARAWDVLEARKAILRGIGSPKPVPAANDPTIKPKRQPAGPGFSESREAAPRAKAKAQTPTPDTPSGSV